MGENRQKDWRAEFSLLETEEIRRIYRNEIVSRGGRGEPKEKEEVAGEILDEREAFQKALGDPPDSAKLERIAAKAVETPLAVTQAELAVLLKNLAMISEEAAETAIRIRARFRLKAELKGHQGFTLKTRLASADTEIQNINDLDFDDLRFVIVEILEERDPTPLENSSDED